MHGWPPRSTVDKTWRNEWQKLKSVEHKIKTLDDARLKRCDHSAGPGQEVGQQAKRALFISAPVTRSVASVPCQRSGRTFLDCKAGTRPEPCRFNVRKQSCTLGNFVVNLGNLLYLLIDCYDDIYIYIYIIRNGIYLFIYFNLFNFFLLNFLKISSGIVLTPSAKTTRIL